MLAGELRLPIYVDGICGIGLDVGRLLRSVEDVIRRIVNDGRTDLRGPLRAMTSSASPLTACASSGSLSARSTAVYAAALTMRFGRRSRIAARIESGVARSSCWRSNAVRVPSFDNRIRRSCPIWPFLPVSRIFRLILRGIPAETASELQRVVSFGGPCRKAEGLEIPQSMFNAGSFQAIPRSSAGS